MRLVTKRSLIERVAECWRAQYYSSNTGWKDILSVSSERVYSALVQLPAPVLERDVTAIIGNPSWTLNGCRECKRDVDVLVAFSGYDNSTVNLCYTCLTKAGAHLTRQEGTTC